MGELVTRIFRVTLEVTVTANEIDEELAAETKRRFNNDALARDPMTTDNLARDRRLLAAVVGTPEALRGELLRQVSWALDPLHPYDQVLAAFGASGLADTELIERLRTALIPDDYQGLRDLCDDEVFYDNTSFYQAAFTTRVANFRLQATSEGNEQRE